MERQALPEVFGQQDWRVWTDTLFETLGVVVTVADLQRGETLFVGPRGAYCDLLLGGNAQPEALPECFPQLPSADTSDVVRVFCRASLPCYFAPVVTGAGLACHVIVEGFVTSTRERRRLFEHLLARGAAESEARSLIHGIPVFASKRAEAIARMVATHASTVLIAEQERCAQRERTREMEAIVHAVGAYIRADKEAAESYDPVLEQGIAAVGADEGALMLLRPGSDLMDVVASRGAGEAYALGDSCRFGEGIPGHVVATGRTLLMSGRPGDGAGPSMTVAVPVMRESVAVGVLVLGFRDTDRRLSPNELSALETFAELAGAGLRHVNLRSEQLRELGELRELTDLASGLQGDVVLEQISAATLGALSRNVGCGVAGLVLAGRAHESVELVVREDVTTADLEGILDDATGVPYSQFDDRRVLDALGEIVESEGVSAEWTVLSVPLTARDVGIGYIFAAASAQGSFDAGTERFMWELARQVAPAFDRVLLFERLRDDYARTIAALSAALDANERRQTGHSTRVMDYAMAIGEELGLGYEQLEVLRFAGLLHDIGKIGVSEEILIKPSQLSAIEMQQMRLHSQIGASLLEQVEFLNTIAPVVLYHHERWDGEGYPTGLAGEDIPLLARVLAVADAYDAMTSDSPYRGAIGGERARRELQAGGGTQFDPDVVVAMIRVLARQEALGLTGMLSESLRRNGPTLPA